MEAKKTYSHGAKIRLLEVDRWFDKQYLIQEYIPALLDPGPYQIYPGWHNRDEAYPTNNKQSAIALFFKYKKEGISYPPLCHDYMPIGDSRVILEEFIEQ
jgi:hypothetical protein